MDFWINWVAVDGDFSQNIFLFLVQGHVDDPRGVFLEWVF